MYIPHHFREQDELRLLALMEQFSFATLVTSERGAPVASHLPVLVRYRSGGDILLRSHMAQANPQWRSFMEGGEVLVIFQGPHGYVSPSWYVTAPSVPTWNYASVHAYGRPCLIEEPEEVLHLLREMSNKYEAGHDIPWEPGQAEEYVQRILSGLVAFEIHVTRLEGKFKLSQNRSEPDQRRVVEALERSASAGDQELAALMRARKARVS
jgi:transcriptional regulator